VFLYIGHYKLFGIGYSVVIVRIVATKMRTSLTRMNVKTVGSHIEVIRMAGIIIVKAGMCGLLMKILLIRK
jgi:hypothetical protein